MKVYRLRPDIENYQYFVTEDDDDLDILLDNPCQKKKDIWQPIKMFIYRPHLKKGDFFGAYPGCPILSPNATEILRGDLELAGEMLPLPYKDEVFTFYNITNCYSCLDHEKTSKLPENSQSRHIKKYIFHPDRFGRTMFFKTPETHDKVLLLESDWTGENIPQFFEESGLKGYILEELWEG